MAEHYIYKPDSENIVKTVGSEEQGWRFYFVLTKVSPTPTNTPSSTVGSTPTGTPTNTPTPSVTRSQTPTPTQTPTVTPTATYIPPEVSPSTTSTLTATPSNTPTSTPINITPTPSNTPNLTCGTQFIFNGPFDCMEPVQIACYAQNSSNNLTVYANKNASGQYLATNSPVYIDSNCNQYLNPDGFYTVNLYYENGSPVSIERQIIYVKDGHILYYFGGCSSLSYYPCYVCNPSTGCSQTLEQVKLGQLLLDWSNCTWAEYLCGVQMLYYCECNLGDALSPCCPTTLANYYESFDSCQAGCSYYN